MECNHCGKKFIYKKAYIKHLKRVKNYYLDDAIKYNTVKKYAWDLHELLTEIDNELKELEAEKEK